MCISLAFLLSLLAVFLAKRGGFFRLPEKQKVSLSSFQLLGAFLIYFATALLVLRPFAYLLTFLYTGKFTALKDIPKELMGIINLSSILLLFLAMTLYIFYIDRETRRIIFGSSRSFLKIAKSYGFGALTLFICYPLVLFVNLAAELVVLSLFGASGVKQVAVQQLQQLIDQPLIFLLLGLGVIFLVPFIEETLFRGFLQNWLKRYCGRGGGIVLASLFFSIVHYSPSQGVTNIELLLSLFVFSCFLGYLYERERALWAPMGLHSIFNLSSVIAIFVNGAA